MDTIRRTDFRRELGVKPKKKLRQSEIVYNYGR
jgi:hypothetical protein